MKIHEVNKSSALNGKWDVTLSPSHVRGIFSGIQAIRTFPLPLEAQLHYVGFRFQMHRQWVMAICL